MSDYPMLISNKLHSFRNFYMQRYEKHSMQCSKTLFFVHHIPFLRRKTAARKGAREKIILYICTDVSKLNASNQQ